MNLFWAKLFGRLESTAKFEQKFNQILADYRRYIEVQNSRELAEYQELFHKVNSAEFKEKKRVLVNRKYKDTQEFADMRKYTKLHENAALKQYYKTLQSPELETYLAFKLDPDYELLSKKSEVKKSDKLKELKRFEKSKAYKNYMRFHNSFIVNEYEELKAKVHTPEFEASNAFWKDKDRWANYEDSKLERRFSQLRDNPDIKFYNATDSKQFTDFEKYALAFEDRFSWNTLNASKWEYGFRYKSDKLMGNHSFANEKQANTASNVTVVDGLLTLKTKKEEIVAPAWDTKLGFVNKSFNFTSGVLHGEQAIAQQGGVFRAKIRFKGHQLTQAFWLSGYDKLPHINICICNGKTVEVGSHWKTQFENKYASQTVKGLSLSDFHIYTLVWNKKELIWYVNNIEIFRTKEGVPSQALFPMFNAFISQAQRGGEGSMEVDFVEVYSRK